MATFKRISSILKHRASPPLSDKMRESAPPESTPPSRWHPLVISVIGLLCTMFLLLSCYRILRTGRRHLDEETREEPSLQFHSRGLDSSIVQCLPIIQYTKEKKKNDSETEPGDMECTVCLGDFEPGDMLRFLPNCAHSFHVACVDTWFKSHSNCPLCRSSVLYNSNDHHRYSVSVLTSVESHRREAAVSEAASSSHDSSLQDSTVRPPFQQISFT